MNRCFLSRLLCFAVMCSAGVTDAVQPNILLIVSEDNGPELGCYGDVYARTPNLDQLADEGFASTELLLLKRAAVNREPAS